MKLDSHDRRRFVMFLLGGLAAKQAAHAKNTVKIAEFSPSGQRKNVIEVDKIRKPDAEWKAQLTPEQRQQIYEGNARRVYPRLDAALKQRASEEN